MTLYTDIKTKFDAISIPRDSVLEFSQDDFGIDAVTAFFDRVLLVERLTVSQAAKTSTDSKLMLTGRADLLGYSNLDFTWQVTPDEDYVSFDVDGTFAADKKITLPVVDWLKIYKIGLKTSLASEFYTVAFSFHGTILLGESKDPIEIPIALKKTGANQWQIGITEDKTVHLPDLNHLAALMNGEATSSFFPQQLADAIEGIAINSLTALFDTESKTVTQFGVAISVTNGWEIAPKIQLKPGLKLSLSIHHLTDAVSRYTVGVLLGTFSLNGTDLPIFVQGQSGSWFIGLQPGKSITLPSLSDLLDLGNQPDLANSLPSGLRNLPGIKINDFLVGFNPSAKAVTELHFSVGTASSWPIIEDYFEIKSILLALDIENVTDAKQRKIGAALRGAFVLGDLFVQCSVEKTPEDENWTVTGTLIPGDSLSLKAISENLFKSSIAIPKEIPALIFEQTTITVVPAQKSFRFNGNSQTPWHLTDKLSFNSFDLFFSRDPSRKEHAITGSLKTSFTITSLTLNLEASLNATPGGGWQFNGSASTQGQTIAIGALIHDIADRFGVASDLPSAIDGLELEIKKLETSFNTKSKDFKFNTDIELSPSNRSQLGLTGSKVELLLDIELTRNQQDKYDKNISGQLTVGDSLQFALAFSQDKNAKMFAAAYNNPAGRKTSIKQLVANVSDNLASVIPDSLSITLKDALIASSSTTETKLLFILHLDNGINLSQLPLVGKLFPHNQTIQLTYQILAASQYFSVEEVSSLNQLIGDGISKLPEAAIGNPKQQNKSSFNLAASIRFGDIVEKLTLPVGINHSNGQLTHTSNISTSSGSATNGKQTKSSPPANNTDKTNQSTSNSTSTPSRRVTNGDQTWFKLQKSFGPVHFERIGVQYQDQKIYFLLDGSLSAGGLTVGLDGLSVNTPLTEFKPKFDLHGLSIDYQNPSVEMGGAFLRKQVTKDGKTYDEYDGTLIAKAKIGKAQKALTLSAIGSYAYLNGHPSMFVYAVLDYPLGGPPFFFVTGFVGAFGYNRTLRIPTIDEVKDFPLVTEAIHNTGGGNNPTAKLKKISQYIPPAVGEHFLAVGIKFTSFKLIDSFALLTASFGNRLEFDILGLSTAILPPAETGKLITPLAKIQMALKVSFVPDEGTLKVEAKLTADSYLLSKNCHLTGGFAFYSWFSGEHSGDFVATLGGYHPQFKIPSHYPQNVPRLGLNWRIDSHTTIKGGAYFALCPHALMAGIHLDATYHSGALKASFKLGADFLIAWKPYHYDARVRVNIHASYTYHCFGKHHINADVGAELHLWGPEFSGTATIHIWVVSITIHFGDSSGQKPQAISWDTFKKSFLPEDTQVCTIAVKDGLVRKLGDDKSNLGVINPKHFSLVTNSVIPSKAASLGGKSLDGGDANTQFGIGSMAVKAGDLSSQHKIEITRNGTPVKDDEFEYIPIKKNVPVGLWGESLTPQLNGPKFIDNALSGFEIRPKNQPNPSHTHAVNRSNLQSDPQNAPVNYRWEDQTPFTSSTLDDKQRRENIGATLLQNSVRNSFLQNMGFDPDRDVDLSEQVAADFLVAPQVKA